MFIKLSKVGGGKVVLNVNKIREYEALPNKTGTLIKLSDIIHVPVEETVEQLEQLLKESYFTIKESS